MQHRQSTTTDERFRASGKWSRSHGRAVSVPHRVTSLGTGRAAVYRAHCAPFTFLRLIGLGSTWRAELDSNAARRRSVAPRRAPVLALVPAPLCALLLLTSLDKLSFSSFEAVAMTRVERSAQRSAARRRGKAGSRMHSGPGTQRQVRNPSTAGGYSVARTQHSGLPVCAQRAGRGDRAFPNG